MKKDRYPHRNYEERLNKQKLTSMITRPMDSLKKLGRK